MAKFEALELAFELVVARGHVLPAVQTHDRDLASQLRRAGASVPSCLSEDAQRAIGCSFIEPPPAARLKFVRRFKSRSPGVTWIARQPTPSPSLLITSSQSHGD